MKKTMTALLASLTFAAAAASAHGATLHQRSSNLEHRIRQGVIDGSLTRMEANRLQRRLWRVERIESSYRRNGLAGWERRDLQHRYDNISQAVRLQRHDDQRRRSW